MDLFAITFWAVSIVAVTGSFLVVISRNPLVSALFLALSFIGTSLLFILLDAHFIALIQVLIYAGAIVVLFIYVIMLLDLSPKNFKGTHGFFAKCMGAIVGVSILFIFIFSFVDLKGAAFTKADPGYSSIIKLSNALFTKYVIPFELISIVLMIGIIGAVLLVKRISKNKEEKV